MQISQRVDHRKPPPYATFLRLVGELEQSGHKVLKATGGQPSHPVASDAISAMRTHIEELASGNTSSYQPVRGIKAVREAVAEDMNRMHSLTGEAAFSADDILMTSGSTSGNMALHFCLNDPGDKVAIPVPCYMFYEGQMDVASLNPVFIQSTLEDGLKLTPDRLDTILENTFKTQNSTTLYLNFPGNPSGVVMSDDEWKAIIEVIKKHNAERGQNVNIVCDAAYEQLRYGKAAKTHTPFLSLVREVAPELEKNVALSITASKLHGMPGERIGAVVCKDQKLIEKLAIVHTNLLVHPSEMAQKAFAASIKGYAQHSKEASAIVKRYEGNCNLLHKKLVDLEIAVGSRSQEKKEISPPGGALFVLADLHELIGTEMNAEAAQMVGNTGASPTIRDDNDIAYHLLYEHNLAVLPASTSVLNPQQGFVRMSFTEEEDVIEEIAKLLETVVASVRDKSNTPRTFKNEAFPEQLFRPTWVPPHASPSRHPSIARH